MSVLNIIFSLLFIAWFFIVAFLIWHYGRKSADRAAKLEEVLTTSVYRSADAAVKAADAAKELADMLKNGKATP